MFRDSITAYDDFHGSKFEYPYYGRLEEIEFLERLYNLYEMESNDSRYSNAHGDIVQHTINNYDYKYVSKIKMNCINEYIATRGKALANLGSEVCEDRVNQEREEAFADAIEIGISNTISILYMIQMLMIMKLSLF